MSEGLDSFSRKQAERAARDERLRRALRENLHRRKEQARTRAGPPAQPAEAIGSLSGAPLSSKTNRHGGTTAD
jgi:hypothetical protein